jgi:hypothetical protein
MGNNNTAYIDPIQESATYALVLQSVRVTPEQMPSWKRCLGVGVQPWMWEVMGAHLLAASSALTGEPGRVQLLWMTGIDYSPARAALQLRGRKWHQEFLGYMSAMEEEVLLPMAYDPVRNLVPGKEPTPADRTKITSVTTSGGLRTYLMDHIAVPTRALGAFSVGKRDVLIPRVTASPFRWRLVASGARVTGATLQHGGNGEVCATVVNFWEIPSPDSLPRIMLHVSEDPAYQSFRAGTVSGEDQHLLLPIGNCDPRPGWSQSNDDTSQCLSTGRWIYR